MTQLEKKKLIKETLSILRKKGLLKENDLIPPSEHKIYTSEAMDNPSYWVGKIVTITKDNLVDIEYFENWESEFETEELWKNFENKLNSKGSLKAKITSSWSGNKDVVEDAFFTLQFEDGTILNDIRFDTFPKEIAKATKQAGLNHFGGKIPYTESKKLSENQRIIKETIQVLRKKGMLKEEDEITTSKKNKKPSYTIKFERKNGSDSYKSGTLEEFIDYCSYTLEVGNSYNSKIKVKPSTWKSFLINHNKSIDEKYGGYYRPYYYEVMPNEEHYGENQISE